MTRRRRPTWRPPPELLAEWEERLAAEGMAARPTWVPRWERGVILFPPEDMGVVERPVSAFAAAPPDRLLDLWARYSIWLSDEDRWVLERTMQGVRQVDMADEAGLAQPGISYRLSRAMGIMEILTQEDLPPSISKARRIIIRTTRRYLSGRRGLKTRPGLVADGVLLYLTSRHSQGYAAKSVGVSQTTIGQWTLRLEAELPWVSALWEARRYCPRDRSR